MPSPEARDNALVEALRPLSRAEVRQLYRHELDPERLRPWLVQADRLDAPWAPPTSELVANGTGWLLAVGATRERLMSAISRTARVWSSVAGVAAGLAALPVAHLLNAAWLVGGTGLLVWAAAYKAVSSRPIRRQLAGAQPLRPGDARQAGQVVRVTGVVAQQPVVPTLFAGAPAVLFRNRAGRADETRGIDFFLDLEGGQRVKVLVHEAFLLERPRRFRGAPACGPVSSHRDDDDDGDRPPRLRSDLRHQPRLWSRLVEPQLYEVAVGPGDRVEVCGVVHHEADPAGEAGPSRGVPLRAVLAAGPGVHLLVRRQHAP
jgi:hypothetical protein